MEKGHFLWKKRKIKEEEQSFPIYSSRSQQDMSTMVSALVQVIGGSDPVHQDPITASQFSAAQSEQPLPYASQDQAHHADNNEQPRAPIALPPLSPLQLHGTGVTDNNSNNNNNIAVPRFYYGSGDMSDSSGRPLSAASSSSSSSSGQQQELLTFSMQFGGSSSSTSQPAPRNWTGDLGR